MSATTGFHSRANQGSQLGGGSGFSMEPGLVVVGGEGRSGEEFEGDSPVETGVQGFVDDAHAALA